MRAVSAGAAAAVPPGTSAPAPHEALVLSVVGLGTLLTALAGSMIGLALPTIGRELHLTVEHWHWIVQVFLLSNAVLLLPVGRLGDIVSHRRVYLAGLAVYGVASLVCGLSSSFVPLLVGRILQGVGAAMAMSTGPALLTTALPAARRGRALGVASTATYTGLTLGPPLSGLLLALGGWRIVFLFAVPLSLIVCLVGQRRLTHESASGERAFDVAGALTSLLGALFFLFALGNLGHARESPSAVAAPAVLGLMLLTAFVLQQRRRPAPLLDLSLFRSPLFTGAILSALANYAALFAATLLLPFYLEEGLGLPPALAGLLLAAQPLAMALVASPAGALSDRIGTRPLAVAGMGILVCGLWGLSLLGGSSPAPLVAGWLAVVGLGTGVFISPNSSALMGAAPRARQGTASSLLALARLVGMLTGVAVATLLFQLAGGRTGAAWRPADFAAYGAALRAAAVIALLGLAAASLTGRRRPQSTLHSPPWRS